MKEEIFYRGLSQFGEDMNANNIVDFERAFPDNPTKEQIDLFKKEFASQENILQLLQEENKSLLQERKKLKERIIELEKIKENLESKNVLEKNRENLPESSLDSNDETIKSLRYTIHELNVGLDDAEEITNSMQAQLKKGRITSDVRDVSSSQNVVDRKAPTSQAYQHRLITQLKETIIEQQEEIKRLSEVSLMPRNPEVAVKREGQILGKGDTETSVGSSEDQLGTVVKKNEESGFPKAFYDNHIRQLEQALIEKDKCAGIAVEKMASESAKIRLYYENAIKSIIAKQKLPSEKYSEVEPPSFKVESGVIEDSPLGKRIIELEEKIRKMEEKKAPEELNEIAGELLLLRSQKEKMRKKLDKKNSKIERDRMRANKYLLSEIEKLREEYNKKIFELEESHKDAIKRLGKTQLSKEFEDKLRKKWFSLQKTGSECFMNAVIDRLIFLENYCLQKDMEMELNIRQILRVAEMESNLEKQKAELCMEEKNIQIREFQYQLDSLLRGIYLLKNMKTC